VLALGAAGAAAHPVTEDGFPDHHQHGGETGHLPATSKNVRLVGKTQVSDAAPGRVADVGAYGNYAYLGKYDETGCENGGVYVIDVSNPANPRQIGLIPGHEDTYTGEGVQVVHLETAKFRGEILVQNNESCGKNSKGGVSLWDVTNPTHPMRLVENVGDFTIDGGNNAPHDANTIHSAFAWQQGTKAYVVMIDNHEALDVDILDITDPKHPVLIAETGLPHWPDAQNAQSDGTGTFAASFFHDVDVQRINGVWTMVLSYWDAGWVLLNVNDPASPRFIADSDYPVPDTLFPSFAESEGNAHQAEWTSDFKYLIGTDEDFSPYRSEAFTILNGAFPGEYEAGEFGWTPPIAQLPDHRLNGPTVFGGYGCPAGDAGSIPDPSVLGPLGAGEEAILVLSRGPVGDPNNTFEACFFSEKVEQAQLAGYDAVIIGNHHQGAVDEGLDAPLCGSQGHSFTPTIPAVCIGHETFHKLFSLAPDYSLPYDASKEPVIGALGADVDLTTAFDGWGYVRVLNAQTLEETDAWAIDEATQEQYAFGYGDLSIHEVATDPDKANLAYFAYYSGGFRVGKVSAAGDLTEVGRFIDAGGNNFWGVQVLKHPNGQQYVLASDRDYGLYIFQYTGR
jgi:hypothetical protein